MRKHSQIPRAASVLGRSLLSASIAMALYSPVLFAQEGEEDVAGLSDLFVTDVNSRSLLSEPSTSSFGFDKPLLETPRSVSLISQEAIELYGLSAVEDLVTLVPGVFTTTRFGIQGSVDVRNVSADTYFRGMKRVNLQGHARSVMAAMDSIEVVKGPPSPIYGMGKIGGYTNMTPKSGRARTGAYLPAPEGFSQMLIGSFNRQEFSLGVGGPVSVMGKDGGYYVYTLIEDSGSYSRDVEVGQKILQASMTLDDFIGDIRLETGMNFQRSNTQGALIHRLNQDLVDNLTYIRGDPLVNLDANGDGAIGYYEFMHGSPVLGKLGSRNEPLRQYWDWPTDDAGNPLPIDQFPTIAGIPQSMYDYLEANPEADPDGLLRAQGVGGPLPMSGYVPVGMVLDPRTVGYDTLDPRRSGGYERDLQADLLLGYVDLIYDLNPDFTVKNQLFYDSMDQYKISEQPGGGKQDIRIVENRLTVTKRLSNLPEWVEINSLAAVNGRFTESRGHRYGGDFSSNRMDLMARPFAMTPNTTFATPFDNPDLDNGGAFWTSHYETQFSEVGLGLLFDIELSSGTNLILGARYDESHARMTDYGDVLISMTGTSANPGAIRSGDRFAKGVDYGRSWSVSLTQDTPWGVVPYATLAESSLMLDSSNNNISRGTIDQGHIGYAELKEFGIKGSLFDGMANFSIAYYNQTRTKMIEEDDGGVITAEVSSTRTKGVEAELKLSPMENLFISFYALKQETKFEPNLGGNIMLDARTLGFQDVLDANGNVVYPAEAFLFGGRAYVDVPDGMDLYEVKQGNPEYQFGVNANYRFENGIGLTMSGNYFDSVYSGRLQTVKLPETKTLNLGVFYDTGKWNLKLDVRNATDEKYWRARTGDSLGEALAQTMPGRTWVATVKTTF